MVGYRLVVSAIVFLASVRSSVFRHSYPGESEPRTKIRDTVRGVVGRGVAVGRGGGGGCWERRETQRSKQTDTGSDESHFSVSLIVRDKVTRQCPHNTTFEQKGEPKRIRTEVPLLTILTPYR